MYDLTKLNEYVENGLLRKSEDDNLIQFNYSEKCNNEALWDDITAFNRGNIYEKATGNLIAQAMPKFMNFSQLSEEEQQRFLSHDTLYTTEKKDGCLGILYLYNGEIRFNSRGGFDNYVTDVIKRLLPKYCMLKWVLQYNTLCVEVISPQTKIICDYGNEEELYLLSAISKNEDIGELDEPTTDMLAQIIKMPRPKRINLDWDSMFKWAKEADFTEEGFVVCIPSKKYGCWERVKIKSEDYLKIAKLKACLNKKSLWRMWKNDLEQNTNVLEEYLKTVPDELYKIAKSYMEELEQDMQIYLDRASFVLHDTRNLTMKALANFLNNDPIRHVVFAMRNEKDPKKVIIKMIEPEE